MTVIGPDRTGLVETIAGLVTEHGGNWLESRMCRLGGEFQLILRGLAVFCAGPPLGNMFEKLPAELLFVTGAFAEMEADIKQIGGIEEFFFLQPVKQLERLIRQERLEAAQGVVVSTQVRRDVFCGLLEITDA